MIPFLSAFLFPALMTVAGTGDVLTLRIPNWLNLLIAALFFPMALAAGMPAETIILHSAVGAAMLVAGFALFSLGLFGGGDAKLLAAAGLWVGWPALLPFLMGTAIAGGVLAVAVGVWSMVGLSAEIEDTPILRRLTFIKPNVPYGFAFAVGAILVFPQTWWMMIPSG
ncbi:prepilin peptidase [Aestuariivirga sp.]|uniref:A24 family peptidase n=1 Tax=Aestuariivirga sp. TaxID=2650926 RepID=UPI00391AB828